MKLRTIIATDGGSPSDTRKDAWGRAHAASVINVGIEARPSEEFRAKVSFFRLRGLTVSTYSASPMHMGRPRTHVTDEVPHLTLSIPIAGTLDVRQKSMAGRVEPGAAVLLTTKEASDLALPSGGEFIGIRVERDIMAEICGSNAAVMPRVITGTQGELQLLSGYVGTLTGLGDEALARMAPTTAGHMYDLVAAILRPAPGAAPMMGKAGQVEARRVAVMRSLRERASDPDLSLAGFSARAEFSERTVQNMLSHEGTNFSDFLRMRRLDAAKAVLRDPTQVARSVADIAFAVGFADLSTFNRGYRARFGMTPTEARDQATLAPEPG